MKRLGPFVEKDRPGGEDAGASDTLSAEVIRAQLDRILSSEIFVHAERLSRFLRFAVEQAIQGQGDKLKEYVLGVEVFDRESSYDPRTDPIVRVEAGRLRSKLREYYETHGRDDPILIDLFKGGYAPVFRLQTRKPQESLQFRRLRDKRNAALLVLVIVTGVSLLWATWQALQNRALERQLETAQRGFLEQQAAAVWGHFFDPETETFIVFGSPLFFSTPDSPGLFLRMSTLNDSDNLLANPEFKKLQERFGVLSGPRYDYALMGDAIALQRLTAFLGHPGRKLTALPSHLATWESIRGGHIIFLGAERMNPLLKSLPVRREFDWDRDHNIVNRNPQPGEQAAYVTRSHWDEMTYAIIASLPGLQPDRKIFLLSTHSAPGSMAAVDYVTRPETLRAMTGRLQLSRPGAPKHYEMLIRVFCDRGTAVKTEYVTHHWLSAQSSAPRP